MKRSVLLLLMLVLFPFLALSQSGTRIVKGQIKDESGKVVNDATIKTEIDDTVYQSNPDGTFVLSVPAMSRYLFFTRHNCLEVKKEIDGSYIMVIMKLDKKAVEAEKKAAEAAQKEADAAAKAEAKAEAEAKAKADKEAAAVAKAEAQAKAKADKAANAEAEKARKEAEREAKVKAETEARIAAETARHEADLKERAEQHAREQQEKAAKEQLTQEKKAAAANKSKNKEPKERKKFDFSRLKNSIELGYAYKIKIGRAHV